LNPRTLLTSSAIALLSLQLTACEAIGTIFKAGMWVGVLGVLGVVVLVVLATRMLRR